MTSGFARVLCISFYLICLLSGILQASHPVIAELRDDIASFSSDESFLIIEELLEIELEFGVPLLEEYMSLVAPEASSYTGGNKTGVSNQPACMPSYTLGSKVKLQSQTSDMSFGYRCLEPAQTTAHQKKSNKSLPIL